MIPSFPGSPAILAAAATCVVWACATNPATGRRELMLVSEGQEIAMGRQADPEIVATFGVYADAALGDYVSGIGQRLAGLSERPELPWTFRVLDDPVVNAFALPGGFNYVTRGIMAHFESEAQLAAVMGHEIGHVTARHSAAQMTQQTLAGVGLVAGMILVPDLQEYAGVAGAGLQLLFLKFSRDDEREADALGFRYLYRAGYDPREMPGVFAMLSDVSRAAGGGRAPEWLSTHPDPENRQGRIRELIAQLPTQDFAALSVRREAYLRRLDGMVYGANPREGYFRGDTFLHPDLRFQITLPHDWRGLNRKQALLAQPPNRDGLFELTIVGAASPVVAARDFASQEGVRASAPRSGKVNGHAAASTEFSASTSQGTLEGLAVFVAYGGNVYRLLAYASPQRWRVYEPDVRAAMGSFDRLTDQEALTVEPMRIRVVETPRPMTLAELAAARDVPVPVETLALLNQTTPDARLPAGRLVKLVAGSPPP